MQTSSAGRSRTERTLKAWKEAEREAVRAATMVELNPGDAYWGTRLKEAKAAAARAKMRYLESRGQAKLELML